MNKYEVVENYLDELFPNPKCELDYFNDYSLLIAIMLSAQTTDKRVNVISKVLFEKYKTLKELSEASLSDLKEIIRPLGNFNRKASNVLVIAKELYHNYNGQVPIKRSILESFPGVGRKTVNVFFSEYLKIPAIAVDTHVERVMKRLRLVRNNSNVITIEKTLMRNIAKENWARRHLQLVLFGRYYCKAKKPECLNCKLKDLCNNFDKTKSKLL